MIWTIVMLAVSLYLIVGAFIVYANWNELDGEIRWQLRLQKMDVPFRFMMMFVAMVLTVVWPLVLSFDFGSDDDE